MMFPLQNTQNARNPFSPFVFAFVFVLLTVVAPADAKPRVELYTMGPGDALFSKFGHTALCVVEQDLPAGGLCYNYGTADFSRPLGLGWDVVRARAKFWVSVSDRVSMLIAFQSEDRSIYRQVLPLSEEQIDSLVEALENDALPENREYIYSHFLDNCSTRPRDLIDGAANGVLRRSTIPSERTYRDYAREGLAAFHWALVPGGDLILGRWVDRDIDAHAAMFIPEILAEAVTDEFGAAPESVYERQGPTLSAEHQVAAALVRFWILVLAIAALAWISRWGAAFAIGVVALLGTLLWAGAILSPWPELRVNELMLVFVPFDVVLWWSTRPRYVLVRLIMLVIVAVLALIGVFVQPVWPYWTIAIATLTSFWWRGRKDILAP